MSKPSQVTPNFPILFDAWNTNTGKISKYRSGNTVHLALLQFPKQKQNISLT